MAAALPTAGYDPVNGFAPVGMIAHGPLVWVVANKDLPASTLPELIALAKQRPGVLNYGSAGVGGINHLVLESLEARAGIYITHIPYRGIAPATLDTISGQLQLLTGTIPALAPHIRDGKLKALAVTSPERSPALPNVPGMKEAGMADFNVLNYFALVAPRGTPDAVVQQINAALAQVVQMPDVKERLAKDALEPAVGRPAQLGQFLQRDLDGWKAVVKKQGLKIDAFGSASAGHEQGPPMRPFVLKASGQDESVTVARWLVRPGDTISEGDYIGDLEADKAAVDLRSPASGLVEEILVPEGAMVKVGTPVLKLRIAEGEEVFKPLTKENPGEPLVSGLRLGLPYSPPRWFLPTLPTDMWAFRP